MTSLLTRLGKGTLDGLFLRQWMKLKIGEVQRQGLWKFRGGLRSDSCIHDVSNSLGSMVWLKLFSGRHHNEII